MMVMTKVTGDYYDVLLDKHMPKGTKQIMTMERAEQVKEAGFIEIIGGV